MPTQQDMNDALRSAAFAGLKDVIEPLLDKGAEIEGKDSVGNTALFVAVVGGHLDVAAVLLENGADINAKDFTWWTPLMRAAHMGLTGSVRFLLEKGAAADWEDENHQTALTLAQWGNYAETVELLEKWPNLPEKTAQKEPKPVETPASDLTAERLERLKSQRPKQSPFRKNQP
ncbi:MAG: ankyrin repeat domain-containing protein [Alphaproteobacteria bacterium]|nr:ankyrin repeat domain-containing protein [Alphaproteobacteria bacterium]